MKTKELIFKTFIEILKEKPFDKITVKDIVDKCQINRNTFYYHYSDIYELLEEIFSMEFSEMASKHSNGFRWLVGVSQMLETAYRNKKIINNICASRSYEYLETYMFKYSKIILSDFFHEIAEKKDIDEEVIEFMVSFYQYAISGVLSEWFRTGMPETPDYVKRMILIMLEGVAPSMEFSKERFENDDTV